jgi:hypothetical protein
VTPIFSSSDPTVATSGSGGGDIGLLYAQALNPNILALTYPGEGMGNNSGWSDARLYLQMIWVPEACTVSGVLFFQVTAGNFTNDNYTGVSLYSLSGSTATLLVESANDNNLFKGNANEWKTKLFSSTYDVPEAGLYAIGVLNNRDTTTTIPTIGVAAQQNVAAMNTFGGSLSSSLYLNAGQNSNPASIDLSTGVTNNSQRYMFGLV